MRSEGWIERLSAMGTAAQATVPGLYAWGVTVAPGALAHGASSAAKLAAATALAALVAGPLVADRLGGRTRIPLLWAFVLASAIAWSTAPASLAPLQLDAPRGLAGMLGWALFAMMWSAPALRAPLGAERLADEEPGAVGPPVRSDAVTIAGGLALAAILQAPGWAAPTAERALLVRFVGLAAGLSILGATTDVVLARHAPRIASSHSRRLRRGLAALVVLGILLAAGLLFRSGD